jgi:hypothetical protein
VGTIVAMAMLLIILIVENSITFGEPGPTTMQFVAKEKKFFLDMMRKINKYSVDQMEG